MIDETIARRLAYVKSLYINSKNQFQKNSDIEISRSLVSLDASVEAFFWLILNTKKPDMDTRKIRQFYDIVNEVKKFAGDFDINSIKELHKVRNRVQHDGILIAKSQADRYYLVTNKLFHEFSENIFGIPWNTISLSLLIQEPNIARLCQNGENFLQKEDFANAAKSFIMAFELAKINRQSNQFGSGILFSKLSAIMSGNESIQNLYNYVDSVQDELEVLKLGLDYMKWREYRFPLGSLKPSETLYSDETVSAPFQTIDNMTLFSFGDGEIKSWLINVLPFIYESILYWQDSVSDTLFSSSFFDKEQKQRF